MVASTKPPKVRLLAEDLRTAQVFCRHPGIAPKAVKRSLFEEVVPIWKLAFHQVPLSPAHISLREPPKVGIPIETTQVINFLKKVNSSDFPDFGEGGPPELPSICRPSFSRSWGTPRIGLIPDHTNKLVD